MRSGGRRGAGAVAAGEDKGAAAAVRPSAAQTADGLGSLLSLTRRICADGAQQVFLELGENAGLVARELARQGCWSTFCWRATSLFTPQLQRRLRGWISSAVARGVILWLPLASEVADAALLWDMAVAASRAGCPCIIVGSGEGLGSMTSRAGRALSSLPQARVAYTANCLWGGSDHRELQICGVGAGSPPFASAVCHHRCVRAPRLDAPSGVTHALAAQLGDWIRQASDRMATGRLSALLSG